MTRTIRGVLAATLLAGTSAPAMAQGLGWRVSEAAGPVTIRHGTATRPAQRGATLEAGDAVQTGPGGRAVLVRAKDFVTVSANSRVTVPVTDQATGFVKIMQDLGNAIFKIEKLGVPHFGVNTPYLAAVVKGTTFSVTVDPAGTSLQVVEGAVEVATLDGGARDLVRPGDVATIAAGDLYRLRVQGDVERTVDSPARPPEPADATGDAAATEPSTTPVIALSSPAPVAPAPAVNDGAVIAQAIGEAISSKPVDLAAATGGMILGTTGGAALIATVRATEVAVTAAPLTSPPIAETSPPAPEAPPSTPAPAADTLIATTPAPTTPPPVEAPAVVTTPVVTPPPVVTSPVVTTPAVTTPVVTAPVVTIPAVTAPVVTAPVATAPVVTTPVVTTPVATTPVVETPIVTTPVATPPVSTAPVVTTPVVTTPVVTPPATTTPVVTAPDVTTPVVTAPVVTTPVVTTPVVTTPVTTTPVVTTPAVTTPVVTAPAITTPVVTTPVVTTPVVTTPVVTTPVVTTPVVTTPVVTTPVVTTPVVTTPVVTTPVVTTPVVTTPVVTTPTLPGIVIGIIRDVLDNSGKGSNGRGNNGRGDDDDRPGLGLGRDRDD